MKYALILIGAVCLLQILEVRSQAEGGRRGGASRGEGMDPLARMLLSGGRRGRGMGGGLGRGAGLLAARGGGMEFNDLLPFLLMRNMRKGGKGGSLFGGKGGMNTLLMMSMMGGGLDLGI